MGAPPETAASNYPSHGRRQGIPNFRGQGFSGMARINRFPTGNRQNPDDTKTKGKKAAKQRQQAPWRKRLFGRTLGLIEDLDAGNLLGSRALGHLILLGKNLKHTFFSLGPPIEVRPRYTQEGKL